MKTEFQMFILAFSIAGFLGAQTVAIDTNASVVEWIGKKVTGQHSGEVRFSKGVWVWKENTLIGGEFEVNMGSMTVTDPKPSDKDNLKLLNHLKNDDFFGIKKFPTATFKLTSAVAIAGSSTNQANWAIKGDMTIKGVTKPIEFNAVASKKSFEGNLEIDRTLWGIKFKSGKYDPGLGNYLIYDMFPLKIKTTSL